VTQAGSRHIYRAQATITWRDALHRLSTAVATLTHIAESNREFLQRLTSTHHMLRWVAGIMTGWAMQPDNQSSGQHQNLPFRAGAQKQRTHGSLFTKMFSGPILRDDIRRPYGLCPASTLLLCSSRLLLEKLFGGLFGGTRAALRLFDCSLSRLLLLWGLIL
jgi:hypothetical protein